MATITTIPTRILPAGYELQGMVSIRNRRDLTAMLIWSILLLVASAEAVLLTLDGKNQSVYSLSIGSLTQLLSLLGGVLLVTVVMVVLHEGLHGLVFWLVTHEVPKFSFKWYYASASPAGWYLPRIAFLAATLLPLVAITTAGLILLPAASGYLRYLLVLLTVFNASGCAGDVVVALRLLRLPRASLLLDRGDEVLFFAPASR